MTTMVMITTTINDKWSTNSACWIRSIENKEDGEISTCHLHGGSKTICLLHFQMMNVAQYHFFCT